MTGLFLTRPRSEGSRLDDVDQALFDSQHISDGQGLLSIMAPSMTLRKESRPGSQASGSNYQDEFMVPNRTSSLHSRIAQPSSSSISQPRPAQRAPKTLTHAYMVCGVGREPSQWVKAPQPAQGRITHMKNAVGQFWLPEILGSSPRLEQDNSIARSLHAAMRVRLNTAFRYSTN